ncbi:MAG: hypothetical protein K2J80_03635 [Oscillospiraceae bacterium]|nr:hypothetical protein [Oscillospiraceae bacterium]
MIDLALLYDNCVYSSIAHALYMLREPFFAAERSWDGMNYSYNSFSGIYGTISFDLAAGIAAGAFRDDHSPLVERYPEFKAAELFSQAPENVRRLAENEAIQYLFDERGGVTQPIVTAAFWCVGGEVTFAGGREEFEANGGEPFFELAVSRSELRTALAEGYSLNDEEAAAAELIFSRFKEHTPIKRQEVPLIAPKETKKRGLFTKKNAAQDNNGFTECIASLGELGIVIE